MQVSGNAAGQDVSTYGIYKDVVVDVAIGSTDLIDRMERWCSRGGWCSRCSCCRLSIRCGLGVRGGAFTSGTGCVIRPCSSRSRGSVFFPVLFFVSVFFIFLVLFFMPVLSFFMFAAFKVYEGDAGETKGAFVFPDSLGGQGAGFFFRDEGQVLCLGLGFNHLGHGLYLLFFISLFLLMMIPGTSAAGDGTDDDGGYGDFRVAGREDFRFPCMQVCRYVFHFSCVMMYSSSVVY